ncbi:hypothetical protein WJX73_005674 [Symbiochloris irregularis]|uniref:Serine hydrolase domain-containing protein n=1 Tax=Symbiochloris irregularis TaxID=706552 RepID=A0AAW1NX53_9CHLO
MQRKLKLLALHSFRTSAEIFAQQMQRAGLDTALQDLITVEYLNAPIIATGEPSPDVAAFFSGPYYQWWAASKDEGTGHWTYDGKEQSMEYVRRHARDHGPYDGILAMSQGTILTTLLLLDDHCNKERTSGSSELGRFCIMIAGVIPRVKIPDIQGTGSQLAVPSVHLIGDKDPIKLASHRLMDLFQNPLHIPHSKGHVVPALDAMQLEQLRGFLQAQAASSTL